MFQDVEKAFIDFAFAPEEALAVLDPFKIADRNAAGVAENIGHGEDALGVDNRVGLPGGWAVGAFAQNARLDLMGVLFGDLIFNRGGDGDFTRLEKNVAGGHFRAAAWEILKRFFLGVDPVNRLRNVEAVLVIETAADIGEADDFIAGFLHKLGGQRA